MKIDRSILTSVFIWIYLFSAVELSTNTKSIRNDENDCQTALLKGIPDSAFSASSFLNNEQENSPSMARMAVLFENNNKAWCSQNPVTSDPTEWLQIEFNTNKIITNIFTQGRMGGNYGKFVSHFYLEYQREETQGLSWHRYKNPETQSSIIKSNTEARNNAHMKFNPPIIARRIRILPIGLNVDQQRQICLKIGLYGCDFIDDVLSYEIEQGNIFPLENLKMLDLTYDSIAPYSPNQSKLSGGLGRLMDNLVPFPSPFLSVQQVAGLTVAWYRESASFIDVILKFGSVRKFHRLDLYLYLNKNYHFLPYNYLDIDFTQSIPSVPSSNGAQSTQHLTNRHQINGQIHNVNYRGLTNANGELQSIDLKKYLGDQIKLRFHLINQWFGMTELLVNSEPYNSPSFPSQSTIHPTDPLSTSLGSMTTVSTSSKSSSMHNQQHSSSSSSSSSDYLIYYIVATILGVIVILAIILIIKYYKQPRQNRKDELKKESMLMGQSLDPYYVYSSHAQQYPGATGISTVSRNQLPYINYTIHYTDKYVGNYPPFGCQTTLFSSHNTLGRYPQISSSMPIDIPTNNFHHSNTADQLNQSLLQSTAHEYEAIDPDRPTNHPYHTIIPSQKQQSVSNEDLNSNSIYPITSAGNSANDQGSHSSNVYSYPNNSEVSFPPPDLISSSHHQQQQNLSHHHYHEQQPFLGADNLWQKSDLPIL